MATWESENPELWAACTKGYGEGWWDKTVEQIDKIEEQRVAKGLCAFCGKSLADSPDAVMPMPPRPMHGPFCSPEHANYQLLFYCQREGK
jgi:hypothetical protein